MPRKSAVVTLCILGAVSLGACCCCAGMIDDDNRNHVHGVGHGGVWHSTTHYIWYGGWSSTPTRPGGGSGMASARGGFGATGAAHASGG